MDLARTENCEDDHSILFFLQPHMWKSIPPLFFIIHLHSPMPAVRARMQHFTCINYDAAAMPMTGALEWSLDCNYRLTQCLVKDPFLCVFYLLWICAFDRCLPWWVNQVKNWKRRDQQSTLFIYKMVLPSHYRAYTAIANITMRGM